MSNRNVARSVKTETVSTTADAGLRGRKRLAASSEGGLAEVDLHRRAAASLAGPATASYQADFGRRRAAASVARPAASEPRVRTPEIEFPSERSEREVSYREPAPRHAADAPMLWVELPPPSLSGWKLVLIILASLAVLGWAAMSQQGQQILSRWGVPTVITTSSEASLALPVQSAASGENSVLGAPTITANQIDAVLTKYGSPAAGSGNAWVSLGEKYGIDPAYALAFFIHESSAGTARNWAGLKPDGSTTHNVGNIICAGYATCYNRFRDYPDWNAGIEDWYKLIAREYVEGRGVHTVEEIIPIYAPSFENDVPNYVNTVVGLVQDWRQGVIR